MKRVLITIGLMLIFMISASVNSMAAVSASRSFRVSVTVPTVVGMTETLRASDNPKQAGLISERSLRNIEFTILVRNSQKYLVQSFVVR